MSYKRKEQTPKKETGICDCGKVGDRWQSGSWSCKACRDAYKVATSYIERLIYNQRTEQMNDTQLRTRRSTDRVKEAQEHGLKSTPPHALEPYHFGYIDKKYSPWVKYINQTFERDKDIP